MMGWLWHQLDHMQIICTSLHADKHASTPPLSFYRPDALPATQPTASKHWRQGVQTRKTPPPSYGPECHWCSTGMMWSHHIAQVMRRVAASWTDCSFLIDTKSQSEVVTLSCASEAERNCQESEHVDDHSWQCVCTTRRRLIKPRQRGIDQCYLWRTTDPITLKHGTTCSLHIILQTCQIPPTPWL